MIRSILNFFRGYDSRFSELEILLLHKLGHLLPLDEKNKLFVKMRNINKIQRGDGGRDTIFYEKRYGKILFPEYTRISEKNEVTEFARFSIISRDVMTKNKGDINLYIGNLTGIRFARPIEHANIMNIDSIDMRIVNCRLDEEHYLEF